MILAAGLTPAWQEILLFNSLELGEVNRACEIHTCASGKVLNVGRAAHALGGRCRTLAVVGGDAGESIRNEFAAAAAAVPARWISSETPTRVCRTLIVTGSRDTTELVEESSPIRDDELDAFVKAYREEASRAEIVVLTGSLPDGTDRDLYRDLLGETPGRAILDIRGPELLAALARRPFLVKPNRDELAATLETELSTDTLLLDAMHELNRRGAVWVIVTQGGGPVWATSNGTVLRVEPAATEVVNPIGCGDCLAAGIAWALNSGADVSDALRIGVAAANDNLGQLLPARLDPQRVHELADTLTVAEY